MSQPTMPGDSDDGPVSPSRDFTPRRHDPSRKELDIDFALHDAGPAALWAAQAAAGQALVIGGPRGSFVVADDFDWNLFIGDETALPAIGRRLSELPAGARAIVVAEVDGPEDELGWDTRATVETRWVHRRGPPGEADGLQKALSGLSLPGGEGYAWVACESSVAKMLRLQLLERPQVRREWLKAAGYWRRGAVAQHDRLDD